MLTHVVFIERVAKPACRWMEAFGLNPIALRYVFPGLVAAVRDYAVLKRQNRAAGRSGCGSRCRV